MKVFIGWSGNTSEKIASILKSWLPIMNPHIETLSDSGMEAGANWADCLSQMISSCDCALFCFTEDNVNSTWLSYEAGAVSGQGKSVISILFDMPRARFSSPLVFTQLLELTKDSIQTKESMRVLAHNLNELCAEYGYAVSPDVLDATFKGIYPTIEKMLAEVRKSRESDELERAREYYKRAMSLTQQAKGPKMDGEYLKQDFQTLNSKLDAILSQLSRVSAGNVDREAE